MNLSSRGTCSCLDLVQILLIIIYPYVHFSFKTLLRQLVSKLPQVYFLQLQQRLLQSSVEEVSTVLQLSAFEEVDAKEIRG